MSVTDRPVARARAVTLSVCYGGGSAFMETEVPAEAVEKENRKLRNKDKEGDWRS